MLAVKMLLSGVCIYRGSMVQVIGSSWREFSSIGPSVSVRCCSKKLSFCV